MLNQPPSTLPYRSSNYDNQAQAGHQYNTGFTTVRFCRYKCSQNAPTQGSGGERQAGGGGEGGGGM